MKSHPYIIEKFVHGGFALSHNSAGQVNLIQGAIPGETVLARFLQEGKHFAKGVVTQVLEGSADRVQPPCPFYQRCGGCDFQHMTYPCQLQAKQDILRDLLQRTGHHLLVQAADTILSAPLASPRQFNYRQRIRLQKDNRQVLGFYSYHSHTCIAIDSCMLANQQINHSLQTLKNNQYLSKLLPQSTSLEILFDPYGSRLILFVHGKRKPRPADIQNTVSLVHSNELIQHVYFTGDDFALTGPFPAYKEKGQDHLSFVIPPLPPYTDKELTLSWEVGGFCQVNIEQNRELIKTVLDFCAPGKTDLVLDLFCGMGNFSIPLAEQVHSVLGIEGQGSSIRSARYNSMQAAQNNTEFCKSPIHSACKKLVDAQRQFDLVIIDPPRQGIPNLAPEISQLCKKKLIYISCDPATLCRDLAQLLEQDFSIKKLQPIDMFPQTHHIETVCLLEK